jgi:Predicted transcription factor, homolog of eukaryotic MBF1
MEKSSISRRVRAFRKLKGMTQMELSERTAISIAVIGSIERGTRKPDEQVLSKIAGVLGVSLEELQGADVQSRRSSGMTR